MCAGGTYARCSHARSAGPRHQGHSLRTLPRRAPHGRANRLIDGFASDGLAESIKRFTFPLRIRVILDMLGAPEDDLLFLKRWSEGWITHLTVQPMRPSLTLLCQGPEG